MLLLCYFGYTEFSSTLLFARVILLTFLTHTVQQAAATDVDGFVAVRQRFIARTIVAAEPIAATSRAEPRTRWVVVVVGLLGFVLLRAHTNSVTMYSEIR